ncbi:MAG: phosphonate ABC transporter, permease protein PhnE [Actinomycetota bacterium]
MTAATERLPTRLPRSRFAIGSAIGAAVLTVLAGRAVGFDLSGLITDLTRPNSVVEGLLSPDWTQIWSRRSRSAFIETLQLAVLATAAGAVVALILALYATEYGAPNRAVRVGIRLVNSVIRALPDLLWALLFVSAVGIGALSGLLALFFFSIAVISKLTSDTLDGLDQAPIEAALAAGASTTEMLRTAVIPQILPSYVSFVLYGFEINLRASAVIGLVGAGGIGERIQFFQGRGEWDKLWGLVILFFLVVFAVERISTFFRRRLV